MALNYSSAGEKKRISFGVGVLKIGPSGATPTTDVGFVRSAQLSVTRQKLEVFQGNPKTLVVQYVVQEDVTFTTTGIEWSLDRLKDVFAAGTVTGSNYGFGGDVNLTEVALQFTHQMPAGGTATLRIWKANGQGEGTINFGDDVHEFPYGFRAVLADTNWASVALAATEKLFQLQLDIPA